MDWSIQEIARLAGTTSRTLRHYDAIGLLAPSRIAGNGYRHYDEAALVRLQRILLLRELGLGLPQIAEVLDESAAPGPPSLSKGQAEREGPVSLSPSKGPAEHDPGSLSLSKGPAEREASALRTHLGLLRQEQQRLARQIAAVESTITALTEGEPLMAENMFDGFDHTQYRDEVEQRWGEQAYADSDRWWRGKSAAERSEWQQRVAELNRAWIAVAEKGGDPASDEAQAVAHRHVEWLRGIPGTPASREGDLRGYVLGLGEMYVADPRFGANYATGAGGTTGAEFVRDALRVYAERNL